MSYIAPTAATFKARYPEFTNVTDALVGLVLDEAISEVSDSWCDTYRAKAQMLLTAHLLSLEGEPSRSNAIASGNISDLQNAQSGSVSSMKVGDVSVTYSGSAATTSGNAGDGGFFSKTHYGQRFYELKRANFTTIMVV